MVELTLHRRLGASELDSTGTPYLQDQSFYSRGLQRAPAVPDPVGSKALSGP